MRDGGAGGQGPLGPNTGTGTGQVNFRCVRPKSACVGTLALHIPGENQDFLSCGRALAYLSRCADTLCTYTNTLTYTLIHGHTETDALIHIYVLISYTLKHLYSHTHTLTFIHSFTYS